MAAFDVTLIEKNTYNFLCISQPENLSTFSDKKKLNVSINDTSQFCKPILVLSNIMQMEKI
jgi:hypothetical protein